jgi:hypothetical protein
MIKEFQLKAGDNVIDPFCGSGTTAVECKKRGINACAVDANPASRFAAQVKTNWNLIPEKLASHAAKIAVSARRMRTSYANLKLDPTYRYAAEQGLLERGWILEENLLDILSLKVCIKALPVGSAYKRAMMLATMNQLVQGAANVRFGPELYCIKRSDRIDSIAGFQKRVGTMVEDLKIGRLCTSGKCAIILGDSRSLGKEWLPVPKGGFDAVICSPPYPTEHDYTRNGRLELAFLEHVSDRETLRKIKRSMIRSHTKGIYVTDQDEQFIQSHERITRLAKRIDKKAKEKEYGFARLYGRVTKEYFGGMKRHFTTIRPLLKKGAFCAYVVGDQASYFQTKIKTADILRELAEEAGFQVVEIRVWRKRWATTTQRFLRENILILKNA